MKIYIKKIINKKLLIKLVILTITKKNYLFKYLKSLKIAQN